MSYLNAHAAGRNVYLWSPAPVSMDRGYHKIWEWVKRNAPAARSWGRGKADGIGEMTIDKLAYAFRRSLRFNDDDTSSHYSYPQRA